MEMEEGEDVLADEVAEFVDVALRAMLLRTAYVAGATGVIEGLAEVAEELDAPADVIMHGLSTLIIFSISFLLDKGTPP